MPLSSDSVAQFVASLIGANLREEVEPLLPSGRARLIVQTACELLDNLNTVTPVGLGEPPVNLLAELRNLKLPGGSGSSSADLNESERVVIDATLQVGQGAATESAHRALREMLRHAERVCASDPTLQDAYEFSGRGGLFRQSNPKPDPAVQLADYLRRHPLARNATDISVARLSAGSSKETYAASLAGTEGDVRRLIIRKDAAFSPLNATVQDEYPLLTFLSQFDLPVPTLVHAELDSGSCGSPFIVFESAPGATGPKGWGSEESIQRVVLDVAKFLAKLHSVPIEELRAQPPEWLNPLHMCRSVRGMIDAWRKIKLGPEPLMEAVLAWLDANEPRQGVRQVMVHGDAGFHNILARDGTVTAVVDWEMCHIGPPEEDLGYIHQFVTPVMPWPRFLAAYRENGGHVGAGDYHRFYSVMSYARVTLSLFNFHYAIRTRNPGLDTKDVYVGTRWARRFLIETFRRIVAN